MRSFGLLAVVFLAVVLALSSAQSAFAAVMDQKQELEIPNYVGYQIGYYTPIGQEFQPSLNLLEAVEVKIRAHSDHGDDITLKVREGTIGGTILVTAQQSFAAGFDGWLYFGLTPIPVTPDLTYVIQLTVKSGAHWKGIDADAYPRGRAIFQGVAYNTLDMTFRTYGSTASTTEAVGGVVIPVNTLALIAPWVAVIGLVGCIGTAALVAKKRSS